MVLLNLSTQSKRMVLVAAVFIDLLAVSLVVPLMPAR